MRNSSLRSIAAVRAGGEPLARDNPSDDASDLQRPLPGDGGSALRPGDPWMGGSLPEARRPDQDPGSVPGWGRGSPGSRGADGGLIWTIGGGAADPGPRFDAPVPPGGYRWWYVDALSDDGRFGLTVIAFVGSVFSPYYAWSGWADPLNHCAVNVVLYGAKGHRWAMTERRRETLTREPGSIGIGPSSLKWEGGALLIDFDEITSPIPSRLRGTIRLHPRAMVADSFSIDAEGLHLWRPIAPRADIEATLTHPDCSWRGQGYFDTNAGDEPLETGFTDWDWSRAHRPHDSLLFYDVARRGGDKASLALRIGADSQVERIESPAAHTLPLTHWRMRRRVRGETSAPPLLSRTLEDTPFYARSALSGIYDGEPAQIVHESLSLTRLRSPAVRAMLPFRMPRRFW